MRTRTCLLTVIAVITTLVLPTYATSAATATTTARRGHGHGATAVTVTALRANSLTDPLGIPGEDPRLSWQLTSDGRGVTQKAYQVRVATGDHAVGDADAWDSGKVASDRSVDVRYDGKALGSHTAYTWSVRVWTDHGGASRWSEPATFETGLLDGDEWSGQWIGADTKEISSKWTDYTIDFTASKISGALGVYFRGEDSEHAYMWQLSEAEKALRPHVKNDGYSVLDPTPFPLGFDFATSHDYRIAVDGNTITTSVDGEQLDRRTDDTFDRPGIMGFRTSNPEHALVHDVSVTSADGTVLVDTDFPAGDSTFTAGEITDDGLSLASAGSEAWLYRPDEVPLLRKPFEVDKSVASARLYATAHGVYEMELNGQRIGDQELAPGWTAYDKRIQYQTYDVTDMVRSGGNALGAEVAPGWYAGNVAMFGDGIYGNDTALNAVLRIEYTDGTSTTVDSDSTWRTTPGPVTSADLLDGEAYDARRADEVGDWSSPGYDDSEWSEVVEREAGSGVLEPQTDQPVRVTQRLDSTRIESPTDGTYLYDLGQNMVGHAKVTLQGEPGQTVRIRYGEVLNPDGSLYTANLRSAKATDYYTFATDEPETYQPSFTFHGFRYVEITGVDEAPAASGVKGIVVGSDGDLTSTFSTDSDLVNQLHSNIVWGQRGNFLSIPTDTPARDERMGWTGDINVFSRTAVYNMDSQAFLTKWLEDLRDTQNEDGSFPGVAPVIPGRFDGGYGRAGWADAGVHVPWVLWQAYGDTAVVEENYAAMKRYVDYLDADSTDHIRDADGYLDWLNLDDPTPADVLDTAFVARSTREFAEMAVALGNDADAAAYDERFKQIKAAYQDAFVSEDGTVKGNSQTGYILTITNGLVPEDRTEAVTDKLVAAFERRDWHLSTGFLGVDGLLPALTQVGRTDIAYKLLQNTDYPSWGYEIGHGATTVWERWNSIRPDGSFGDVGMNSFNHYAYGAVGEWMYGTLAGVSALEPGYKKVQVAPQPGEGIGAADFTYRTPYGEVASSWTKVKGGLDLNVEVPGNTTAEVRVPTDSRWAVTEGGVPAEDANGVAFVEIDDGNAVFEVGSGSYEFGHDAVLGALGSAQAGMSDLRDQVNAAQQNGAVSRPVWALLRVGARVLSKEVDAAWSARAQGNDERSASLTHQALAHASDLRRAIALQHRFGLLDDDTAAQLQATLKKVDRSLSQASASLLGAVTTLVVPTAAQVPGDSTRVEVTIDNNGGERLTDITSSVEAPDGWKVQPVGSHDRTVRAGSSITHAYDVSIPAGAKAGTQTLTGEVTYRRFRGNATLPLTADLVVSPAVEISSVSAEPTEAGPGETVELTATLSNRSKVAQQGLLAAELPAGWEAPDPSAYSIGAGEERTFSVEFVVPQTVSEGAVPLAVSTGETEAERAGTTVSVAFTNPPEGAVDHVDLGESGSEQSHALTASASSGTSREAGLTRRYTNSASPGGWFEFDLDVPAGEPFVLRAVETYDHAQRKTYDVVIDGVVVHARDFTRSADGEGSSSFQFVVDEPNLSDDGAVRVRFQDTGADYDPSIADVWAVPLGE